MIVTLGWLTVLYLCFARGFGQGLPAVLKNTTTAKPEEALFRMGTPMANKCAGGTSRTYNSDECFMASRQFRYVYHGTEFRSDSPTGCYFYDDAVGNPVDHGIWLNMHGAGSPHVLGSPICKIDAVFEALNITTKKPVVIAATSSTEDDSDSKFSNTELCIISIFGTIATAASIVGLMYFIKNYGKDPAKAKAEAKRLESNPLTHDVNEASHLPPGRRSSTKTSTASGEHRASSKQSIPPNQIVPFDPAAEDPEKGEEVERRGSKQSASSQAAEKEEASFVVTQDAEVYESPTSSVTIRTACAGEIVKAAGPVEVVDGYEMLPIEPEGAIEKQFLEPALPSGEEKENNEVAATVTDGTDAVAP